MTEQTPVTVNSQETAGMLGAARTHAWLLAWAGATWGAFEAVTIILKSLWFHGDFFVASRGQILVAMGVYAVLAILLLPLTLLLEAVILRIRALRWLRSDRAREIWVSTGATALLALGWGVVYLWKITLPSRSLLQTLGGLAATVPIAIVLASASRWVGRTVARSWRCRRRGRLVLGGVAVAVVSWLPFVLHRTPPRPLVPLASAARRPNVVLVSMDTVRADSISLTNPAASTPALARLAREGAFLPNMVVQSTQTTTSHVSMLTSTYPHQNGSGPGYAVLGTLPTLADALHANGYQTGGFISSYNLKEASAGLGRGFDEYGDEISDPGVSDVILERLFVATAYSRLVTHSRRSASSVWRDARAWLDRRETDRPFFLFLHMVDAHGPYDSDEHDPSPFVEAVARSGLPEELRLPMARYLAKIAYVDAHVGDLLDYLDRHGLTDDTIVAVTADHGTIFLPHGKYAWHGVHLTDPAVKVPLLVRWPGHVRAGVRNDAQVRSVDIAPTLLGLVGLESPTTFHGEALAGHLSGERRDSLPALTEVHLMANAFLMRPPYREKASLRMPGVKLVRQADGSETAFDLVADPLEARGDLSPGSPIAAPARAAADALLGLPPYVRRPPASAAPFVLRVIRSIGYL